MSTSPNKSISSFPTFAEKGSLLLSINHATIRHLNKTLFDALSIEIRQGEQWAILGNSGSGKTALLRTLLGKFNITNGSIHYPLLTSFKKRNEISDPLFNQQQIISFVSQQAHFKNKENQRNFFYQQRYHSYFAEEASTVKNYLEEAQDKREQHPAIPIRFPLDWLVEHLQLESLWFKTLIQLSNGETRRLQIAYALLKQPFFLFMDNPLIGLDHETRPILKQLFKEISQKGVTMVMATSAREIPECITHIISLKNLNIAYLGSKANYKAEATTSVKETWKANKTVLTAIKKLQPTQDHAFDVALKMEDIHVKSSGKVILEGINWEVKKGEKWSLIGPNGAGKSTLLSLISGDHPQTYANKIFLFDQKRGTGESIWDVKRRIGYVSPEMHQYFRGKNSVLLAILSGLDDTMGFRNKSSSKDEVQLAEYWLTLLGIPKLAQQPFKDLSTGNQRLILLIRAMIKNPPLLILDEPCQGLDEEQKNHFKHIVNTLWTQNDKTLLYVSHYKEDIPSCVNHILALEDGKVRHKA